MFDPQLDHEHILDSKPEPYQEFELLDDDSSTRSIISQPPQDVSKHENVKKIMRVLGHDREVAFFRTFNRLLGGIHNYDFDDRIAGL